MGTVGSLYFHEQLESVFPHLKTLMICNCTPRMEKEMDCLEATFFRNKSLTNSHAEGGGCSEVPGRRRASPQACDCPSCAAKELARFQKIVHIFYIELEKSRNKR